MKIANKCLTENGALFSYCAVFCQPPYISSVHTECQYVTIRYIDSPFYTKFLTLVPPPPQKKTLFELSLETHFFIKHLPYNYTYIPCQICVFGSCLEGGTCQGFLTNFAILRGGYFLLILFWHIANQIYSLASFKFINRCPSPVL